MALGHGDTTGHVDLGPVRVSVVGAVTVIGMSHMASCHGLDVLLSSSSSCWPGDKPSVRDC